MHKDVAVKLQNISKVYKLYDKPVDRLKESLHPLKKKYHKEFYALKNINLEIKKGEVLGIVGINGAGKSTLLKIIAGVLTPTCGRVIINGKINAILELSSGLKGEMTGRQNIKLNLQINGIYKDIEKITEDIINFADIGDHIDQPVKTYSSGMKARLGFGLATSTDPDVLIVDEVLAVGDVLFQRKCYSRIERLFKDGKTVIFVSHNAQSVIEFCSNAILLYDREIILEDTPKKVTDFYQKLVFSKDKKKVVDEINGKHLPEAKKVEKKVLKKELVEDKEFYLPDFKSTPNYTNKDLVEFNDIKILSNNDTKVNILKTNNKYKISFNVFSKKDFENVRFGIQIKTIKGTLVSGINSRDYINNKMYNIKKDEKYNILLEFDCSLLFGNYIIRLIVANDEISSILEDAYIFKIRNESWKQGGLVNLKQKLLVTQIIKGNK